MNQSQFKYLAAFSHLIRQLRPVTLSPLCLYGFPVFEIAKFGFSSAHVASNITLYIKSLALQVLTFLLPSLARCTVMWYESGYISLVLPVVFVLPAWYWLQRRPKNALPHPPGPKGYPLIGNLLDFPAGVPLWEGLANMARQHGRVLPSSGLSVRNFDHQPFKL